ncbi:uncharacterized protein VTP21DRAFT_11403 [Calcarisporiella thermophila]|uniref:uncharacterized protein n=1 Tax=Calcarisporiella thermophila TaxID=911321 RepID=UPI0037431F1D
MSESCRHPVQLNQMCAVCGKDLSHLSADPEHATISMSHDVSGLMVTQEEAERLEIETAQRLLGERKLSLIVDLDQTIIHATVDPTAGEWKSDEKNINHPATKDICEFTLPDGPTVYYVKLRPGLQEFLREITQIYELHIYTMGTRNYAQAVADQIDPEGKYFGGRILSRDESGSMTQKNIQRLFPCDTSMVVVIDDRADVWQWSPNLIKVQPYDFFVGIGDINAAFIPSQSNTWSSSEASAKSSAKGSNGVTAQNNKPTTPQRVDSQADIANGDQEPADEEILLAQQQEQDRMMEEQKQSRPLLQRQQQREDQRPVLVDDDQELSRLMNLLKTVHQRFYEAHEAWVNKTALFEDQSKPDVKNIISDLKSRVLQNVHILFSGVIPLEQNPKYSEIWQLANSFGAQCWLELNPRVTHVVAARPGTAKVNAARKREGVAIIRPEWLIDSINRWERQDEARYFLDFGREARGTETPGTGNEDETPTGKVIDEHHDYNNDENEQPFVINDEEINEHMQRIDWDDVDREVQEFLDESGDDTSNYNTDDDMTDELSSKLREKNRGVRRHRSEMEQGVPESRLAKRIRLLRMRRSQLSSSFTPDVDDDLPKGEETPELPVEDRAHDTNDEENGVSDYGDGDSDYTDEESGASTRRHRRNSDDEDEDADAEDDSNEAEGEEDDDEDEEGDDGDQENEKGDDDDNDDDDGDEEFLDDLTNALEAELGEEDNDAS